MTRRLLLTAAVALYVALSLAGLLALASLLPGPWKLLTLPAMAVVGLTASDMIATIWGLTDTFGDEPNPTAFDLSTFDAFTATDAEWVEYHAYRAEHPEERDPNCAICGRTMPTDENYFHSACADEENARA